MWQILVKPFYLFIFNKIVLVSTDKDQLFCPIVTKVNQFFTCHNINLPDIKLADKTEQQKKVKYSRRIPQYWVGNKNAQWGLAGEVTKSN